MLSHTVIPGERRLQERLRLQGGPSVEDYLKARDAIEPADVIDRWLGVGTASSHTAKRSRRAASTRPSSECLPRTSPRTSSSRASRSSATSQRKPAPRRRHARLTPEQAANDPAENAWPWPLTRHPAYAVHRK